MLARGEVLTLGVLFHTGLAHAPHGQTWPGRIGDKKVDPESHWVFHSQEDPWLLALRDQYLSPQLLLSVVGMGLGGPPDPLEPRPLLPGHLG